VKLPEGSGFLQDGSFIELGYEFDADEIERTMI
jgi:hypothetical protein